MLFIVLLTAFLNGYISQVNHHVIELGHIWGVLLGAESSEASRVPITVTLIRVDRLIYLHVDFERPV